tara:strand:- start:884 stop:1267 length:384 start_codon:yes stop_codon:yes gene_type:complete
MLHKLTIQSSDLLKKLNGVTRAEGAAGGGSSGGTTWTDDDATFESDGVAVGDVIYISGEGEFTVDDVTDETTLELAGGTLSDDLSDTSWRITHSRAAEWSDVVHLSRDGSSGAWTIVYESNDFTVSA